jgi:hypothetical protein
MQGQGLGEEGSSLLQSQEGLSAQPWLFDRVSHCPALEHVRTWSLNFKYKIPYMVYFLEMLQLMVVFWLFFGHFEPLKKLFFAYRRCYNQKNHLLNDIT